MSTLTQRTQKALGMLGPLRVTLWALRLLNSGVKERLPNGLK
jgi:hypothetical protein